jgi:hypothetical protein
MRTFLLLLVLVSISSVSRSQGFLDKFNKSLAKLDSTVKRTKHSVKKSDSLMTSTKNNKDTILGTTAHATTTAATPIIGGGAPASSGSGVAGSPAGSGGGIPVQYGTPQTAGSSSANVKNIDNGLDFQFDGCSGDPGGQTVTIYFTFSNPRKVHQRLVLGNNAQSFDGEGNHHSIKAASLSGNSAPWYGVELPTGLISKGSITFSNVLPTQNILALVNIPTANANWDGGGDRKAGTIDLRNVVINWNK